jgi:hypothetical protein
MRTEGSKTVLDGFQRHKKMGNSHFQDIHPSFREGTDKIKRQKGKRKDQKEKQKANRSMHFEREGSVHTRGEGIVALDFTWTSWDRSEFIQVIDTAAGK